MTDEVNRLLEQVPSIRVRADLRDIVEALTEENAVLHGQVATARWMIRHLKREKATLENQIEARSKRGRKRRKAS